RPRKNAARTASVSVMCTLVIVLLVRAFALVIKHNSPLRTVQVIELSATQCPEEGCDAKGDQQDGQRYQQDYDFHRVSLTAFRVTISELRDMPSAASQGGTRPAMAKGTAVTL